MKHTYLFILGDDRQVASIESDGPLPHLKIGVHLDLDTDDYRGTPGTHLEIENRRSPSVFIVVSGPSPSRRNEIVSELHPLKFRNSCTFLQAIKNPADVNLRGFQ